MRLSDDFEDKNSGVPVAYMGVVVFLFLLTVIGVVVLLNRKPSSSGNSEEHNTPAAVETDATDEETETTAETPLRLSGDKRRAEDLDFWDMYPLETESEGEDEPEEESETETETETGPEHDGKHTRIVHENGEEEWVSINPYLKLNRYDYEGLVYQYPVMKYFEDSVQISRLGVDLSKYNGEVDFKKLKKTGVEFVMIRVGARGYGSGQLIQDEKFEEYMQGAAEAGLDIGVYFFSQAISDAEIKEEAQFVINLLEPYDILYPVAYDMELVQNDTARIENLTRDDRTNIAKTFLDTLQAAGYKTILYGTKEWFLLKLDMTKMMGYDVWLSQEQDIPDYPYQFTMWQYTKSGKIDGIDGNVDMNISFVDYSEK
ncbi:MAG: glycoside hydrolase family 25 protein [Lachnospiraceae bacterium]|nr:glycoside hydrolase family 25 protein [Lachnospiraceae bacterium]